jgi:hypothetical protein
MFGAAMHRSEATGAWQGRSPSSEVYRRLGFVFVLPHETLLIFQHRE